MQLQYDFRLVLRTNWDGNYARAAETYRFGRIIENRVHKLVSRRVNSINGFTCQIYFSEVLLLVVAFVDYFLNQLLVYNKKSNGSAVSFKGVLDQVEDVDGGVDGAFGLEEQVGARVEYLKSLVVSNTLSKSEA